MRSSLESPIRLTEAADFPGKRVSEPNPQPKADYCEAYKRSSSAMMSRASLVRCSCQVARKTYIPDDPSTLFDFELGGEHRLRDPAGHRVRSRPNVEIATNCQRDAASNLNRSSAIPDGYL